MGSERGRLNIQINFTNRFLYTFVAFIVLLIIGVGVFAFGTSSPSTFGHSARELDLSGGVSGNAIFNGNVGIGTASPTEKLEVAGNILANNIRNVKCPKDQFVTGFDANSNIRCSAFPAPTFTYSWQIGSWSACSVTCGGGTQTRSVKCIRNDGVIVSNSFCGTKPATSQACNTQVCYIPPPPPLPPSSGCEPDCDPP